MSVAIRKILWEYSMHCYQGVPLVPDQEIKFKIIRINEDSCFLEFKHVFKQKLKQNILDTITQDKKKILSKLNEKIIQIAKQRIKQKHVCLFQKFIIYKNQLDFNEKFSK